jgi:hypothetical protein
MNFELPIFAYMNIFDMRTMIAKDYTNMRVITICVVFDHSTEIFISRGKGGETGHINNHWYARLK